MGQMRLDDIHPSSPSAKVGTVVSRVLQELAHTSRLDLLHQMTAMARVNRAKRHAVERHQMPFLEIHRVLLCCLNRLGPVCAIVLLLAGCETTEKEKLSPPTPETLVGQARPEASGADDTLAVGVEVEGGYSASDSSVTLEQLSPISDSIMPALEKPEFYRGTGILARSISRGKSSAAIANNGDVTLNFVNADIQEVADVILGQTLRVNYIIDPKVKGLVTARTSSPVPRDMVIPVLENILALNGAALTRIDGIYMVVPLKDAATGLTSPIFDANRAPHSQGFGIHIIPVKFTSATALYDILKPFVGSGRVLRVDEARNLLIFGGTGPEASDLMDLVSVFDVDWMEGMSFALFPLEVVDANRLAADLETVFLQNGASPLAGMVKFVPIERLNAILAITPQAAYLDRAQVWIDRLDRGLEGVGRRIFVYRVQHGRATDLADVLRQIFETEAPQKTKDRSASLAPGLTPIELMSAPPSFAADGESGSEQAEDTTPVPGSAEQPPMALPGGYGHATPSAIETVDESGNIRIIADDIKNSLVILATTAEYRMIEATLKKLDFMPLQVLIEVTIAEVTLNDDLQYGLQWFFNLKADNGNQHDFGFSALGSGAVAAAFPGFSYLFTATDVQAVFNALVEVTEVKVLSSPLLMVLDSQTARLQVGDSVPIATQSAVSTTDPGAPVVNSIQFRDTGVILEVTPRVNANGLVLLDVMQEVSNVIPTTTSQLNSPTIQQRSIKTSVAVQSGDLIALGGLIRDNQSEAVSGVPWLSAIPIIGNLFKTTTKTNVRTELLVLIIPRVVYNQRDARGVTKDLRKRMNALDHLELRLGLSE